jgi:hypothetical protein
MISTNLTEESRANLKVAERVAVLRIEPAEKRDDRWVICAALGERTTYLSDAEGIATFRSMEGALKFVQATRPDLVAGVEVGELLDVDAASRPGRGA